MDKNYLIQLTQNLYRLTLLFPKKEPLRYKMRELADDILAENGSPEALDNLAVLDSFFEVAKTQNWVSSQDILNLQQEYSKLKGETEKEMPASPAKRGEPDRQDKILSFLKENGRAQVWQVKQILPEVAKRTLRRDFERLLNQGVIERLGERNETFYQLKIEKA